MSHPRTLRGSAVRLGLSLSLLVAAAGCDSEGDAAVADATEFSATVRIVEVLAHPAAGAPAFVELRNDGAAPANLAGWSLVAGAERAVKLEPVDLSAISGEALSSEIAPHSLALVFDAGASGQQLIDAACESPVATSRAALGINHAASDDILASALELQKLRHCIPVFVAETLGDELASSEEISLSNGRDVVDRAAAAFTASATGVAFERRGGAADAFAASPLGSSPGARNFFRSDLEYLNDPTAPAPISTMSASPWRVGDAIRALWREAAALELEAKQNGDERLLQQAAEARAEADAIAAGKLPHNPLVGPLAAMVDAAETSVDAAFYQLNDDLVVSSLVAAKERGVGVRLAHDAQFINDPLYQSGFERLGGAGIPISYDEDGGRNRSSLAHNKFMVVDGQWVWTGSFNPIEDEPSRIHADNVLLLRSREGAALHTQEFETMFAGTFSTKKRGVGVGGGRFVVDGAPVSLRFSPGMTSSQLKRRAQALVDTGDPRQACEVTLSSGKPALPERYTPLDPCGGPYDLIMGEIARATSSVYFVAFSLSFGEIGEILIERMNNAGVDVRGVVDPTVASRDVAMELLEAGADVRYTPNSDPECPAYVKPRSACPTNPNKVWLHHKFIVIDYGTDHPVLITGSHNLSASAENSNDESLLVVRDRGAVESYYRMFREAFDHPQTMGEHRDTGGLPGLAITEVQPAADPSALQYVEIANVGDSPVALAGLELWNRRGLRIPIDTDVTLASSGRALVVIGGAQLPLAQSPVISVDLAVGDEPAIGLATALVLRSAVDRRWVATYDPYTAEQNLPEGVGAPIVGEPWSWDMDKASLDELTEELLGRDITPEAKEPTWDPKGFYSDWADEHHVTDTSLILFEAPLATWTTDQGATPGW